MLEPRPDGTFWPYLMDFGLVREVDSNTQTSSGGIEGTPSFMAPEQARCETQLLDARTDVYGLGATLYNALTGRPPFVGNPTDVLVDVLLSEPPRPRAIDPTISPHLQTIVDKCLEKEPHRRYDSALTLAQDLGRYLDGVPIAARPPGFFRRAKRFVLRHTLLVASISTALVATLVLGSVALRIRWQASRQARLAQQLGQEIAKMEWLLRSARQLPLHDLAREKVIVRQRMKQLHAELASYGSLSQGLAHYALGRGYMALHEYPQALTELQQAQKLGVRGPEVDYALGFVLGKHFEQAIYEARLSGGGDWAQKQLKVLEPKYLTPATAALVRSRAMQLDAPQYLEGLIAYYQRDYDAALQQAAAALSEAPWLYEASKLAGDVHLDRALLARGRGHYEEAEREFAAAVQSYDSAALVGRSDAEVYEGLAEAWVRQVEMAVDRGQSPEAAYAAAMSASDKLTAAEPQGVAGLLKKGQASAMTLGQLDTGMTSEETARKCLEATAEALQKQPGHPYAAEVAAICYISQADAANSRGANPEPFLRQAQRLLEAVTKQHPHFLWALNDLGNVHNMLGSYMQVHGQPRAKEMFLKSLAHHASTAKLDPTYAASPQNTLSVLLLLLLEARSEQEVLDVLKRADAELARCTAINSQDQPCFSNYFQVYARAAALALQAGQNPEPRLARSFFYLDRTRQPGGSFLDVEHYAALAHFVQASYAVQQKQAPDAALVELEADLARCFTIAAQDAMCRTLAARAEWLQAQWLVLHGKDDAARLEAGLIKAQLATQSTVVYPDAWQTLAEAHLRLARAEKKRLALRDGHVTAGLGAADLALAINPQHAPTLATQGELCLLRALAAPDLPTRRALAQTAAQALAQAIKNNPFLANSHAKPLAEAYALAPPTSARP